MADSSDFEPILPGRLKRVNVAAQALDNQWVPSQLLDRMIRHNRRRLFGKQATLGSAWVRRERERAVRAEYIRSLVNADQVVVNRAYLYNNHAVVQDYLAQPESVEQQQAREAFKTLLRTHVIVPYLMDESDPTTAPKFPTVAFEAWRRICSETSMQCVRLDWNDERNKTRIRDSLSRRFQDFAGNAPNGEPSRYEVDLGLPVGQGREFVQRLFKVSDYATRIRDKKLRAGEDESKAFITRNELYQAFVTSGNDTAAGAYSAKPFARDIKRLFDLAYNTFLPDALSGYPLTPFDSLPRRALQETATMGSPGAPISVTDIVTRLRRDVFARVAEGAYLRSMDLLTLDDVLELRATDEWILYLQSMNALLQNPFAFADPDNGAVAVWRAYTDLMKRATALTERRWEGKMTGYLEKWTPYIELVFEIGGGILTIAGHPQEGAIVKSVISGAIKGVEKVVGRLVIHGLAEQKSQADLSTSIAFLKGRMANAEEQWEELVRTATEQFSTREDSGEAAPSPAAINPSESAEDVA